MKIHFNGAARTVTGSQVLLEVNGSKILLECGLYQGKRSDFYEFNKNFNFNPKEIDALLLSHAHIDHSGNIPNLVKQGFRGKIFGTEATCSLSEIMLQDSGHIQEADITYVNKKRKRRGESPLDPLYTKDDALESLKFFEPIKYNQKFYPVPSVEVEFVEAGHILGSASIKIDLQENGVNKCLWFSGDIGRNDLPLLKDPVLPYGTDYLIMECTYGDKPHRDPQMAFEEFREVVKRTIHRGGKIIIPAFAVGRTQELVYFLNLMVSSGDIPSIPVYVDSPLAVNASDIFKKYSNLFDEETRTFIENGNHKALSFPNLIYTRSVEESKAINDIFEPMVIISASGMAESGRILHHLRNNIENPKNTIMIVSWQAPHTLGRRLAERSSQVRIFGQLFDVRADIATIGGLSAHAGQEMLFNYAKASEETLKNIFLVHGEKQAANALTSRLLTNGLGPIYYPEKFEIVAI